MIKKICQTCSKDFVTKEAWERRSPVRYCSRNCFHLSLKGVEPKGLKNLPKKIGKEHPLWKGNNASYESIHMWLTRWYQKEKCENCGLQEKLEWANKDGKYIRDRNEFIVLCLKCHRIYDKNLPKSKMEGNRLVFDRFIGKQKYPKQRLKVI